MIISDANTLRTHFRIPGGSMTVLPVLTLTDHAGQVWRFDWHRYLGPTFLRRDGEPRKKYPGMRCPMWRAFDAWMDQGRRVDADGNCIWVEPCGALRAYMTAVAAP